MWIYLVVPLQFLFYFKYFSTKSKLACRSFRSALALFIRSSPQLWNISNQKSILRDSDYMKKVKSL